MNRSLVTVLDGQGQETVIGIKLTPALVGKTVACGVLTTMGLHVLNRGKIERDAGKMVQGAALVLLGLAAFAV